MKSPQKPPGRRVSFEKLQNKFIAMDKKASNCSTAEKLRIYHEELRQQHEALSAAQLELEASRNRYAELFDFAPVGYVLLSRTGLIEEINFTGASMLGYSRTWLLKSPFSLYLSERDAPLFFEHMAKCKRAHGLVISEMDVKRKDGSRFAAELVSAPEQNPYGGKSGFRTTLIDMSAHKSLEGSLRCANSELERLVSQRTNELSTALKKLSMQTAERQRLETELAEISEKERRQFGHDLHDDLCQQLAGIALGASALSKTLASKKVEEAEDLFQIAQSINDAITLAKDIARELHPVELTNGGLAAALTDIAARVDNGIRCRFVQKGRLHSIPEESALALFRIAQEAVGNALEHSNAKAIVIQLRATRQALHLSVEDDGVGLPAKCTSEGMGLGIMRYRANAIGAELVIKRSKNGGTLIVCSVAVNQP